MKLSCKFGVPAHGWLPVKIEAGEFHIEFEASDVPIDPIDSLIMALIRVLNGFEDEIPFHLEPACYYLRLTPVAEESVVFRVEVSETDSRSRQHRKEICELTASRDEIIRPLWRAVSGFASHSYSETDWPQIDTAALEKLKELIKAA